MRCFRFVQCFLPVFSHFLVPLAVSIFHWFVLETWFGWLFSFACESGCPLPSSDLGSLESLFLQISFLLLSFFLLTFWDFPTAYINPLDGVPYVPRLSSLKKKKFASPTIMDNFNWPIFEFADYFFSIIKSVVEHL